MIAAEHAQHALRSWMFEARNAEAFARARVLEGSPVPAADSLHQARFAWVVVAGLVLAWLRGEWEVE